MKEKLGVEEDITIEGTYHTMNIQANEGTKNKKKIVVKSLSFRQVKVSKYIQIKNAVLFLKKLLNKNFRGGSRHS